MCVYSVEFNGSGCLVRVKYLHTFSALSSLLLHCMEVNFCEWLLHLIGHTGLSKNVGAEAVCPWWKWVLINTLSQPFQHRHSLYLSWAVSPRKKQPTANTGPREKLNTWMHNVNSNNNSNNNNVTTHFTKSIKKSFVFQIAILISNAD